MFYKRLNSAEGFLLWVMEPWRIVILTFWTFLKLKTTFWKYWIPIKIKISMVCIYKTFELDGPFLWIRFNYLNARATSRREFTFYHEFPRNPWYSFYRPPKDESWIALGVTQWFWPMDSWIGNSVPWPLDQQN